jgi:hypothetical protein
MLKWALVAAGTAALMISSAAGAAVTVTGATKVSTPAPLVFNGATQTFDDWGQNSEPGGAFDGSFTFTNTLSGLYSIVVDTSTIGATIDSISLTGINGTSGHWQTPPGSSPSPGGLSLIVPFAANGDYSLAFTGTDPASGGVATGNFTFTPVAVPEATTWAMMLLGFGAMGVALRGRRRPAFAQIA